MQIKQTSDYAIRIVCFLAQENRMCATSLIASKLVIPYNYIPKVTKCLKAGHIISATEGPQGGYQLAKPPWEISLWDILCATENTMKINNCLENENACSRNAVPYCTVHKVLRGVQSEMEYRLQSITIAELIGMEEETYTQSYYTDILVDTKAWTYQVLYFSDGVKRPRIQDNGDLSEFIQGYTEKYVEASDRERVRDFLKRDNLLQPKMGGRWQKNINYRRITDNRKGLIWLELQIFYDKHNDQMLLTIRDSKLVEYHMSSVEKKLEEIECKEEADFWKAVEYGGRIFIQNRLGDEKQKITRSTELIYRKLAELYPELEITEKEITAAAKLSAIRDLGKLQLPIEILNKKEPLSPEEEKILRMHPQYGAEILKHIRVYEGFDRLYELGANICLYHHERFDGRGYPEGLKGDEIPLCAQVVGLADTYEGLVHPGNGQECHSTEKAIQLILSGREGCFSPRLLHCFVAATVDDGWNTETNME